MDFDLSTISWTDPYVIAGIVIAVVVIAVVVLHFTGYLKKITEMF